MVLEYLNIIWNVVEPLVFLMAVFLFFRDPIRSWNFWGYRPTAVMGLFDPYQNKVIFSKVNNAWSFNQGGIYDNNIYATTQDILKRELGLDETSYKLVVTNPLGKVRIYNRHALTRARISTISIFPNLRGKGYLGCFIRVNLNEIEQSIRKGAGIQETRIVPIEEARKLVFQDRTAEHQATKQKMIIHMLDEIEKLSQNMKAWELKDKEDNKEGETKADKKK